MLKQLLQVAVLAGAGGFATSSFAAISLELKYTTTNESNVGTVVHDGLLQFVLADNDVKVFDRADGQNKLIATRSSGSGFLFGPVQFSVNLAPNTVDLYGSYATHVLHTHVTTDGTSSCDAEITNKLKPDQKVYKYIYPKVGAVDVYRTTITGVSCKFSHIDEPVKAKPVPVAAVAPPQPVKQPVVSADARSRDVANLESPPAESAAAPQPEPKAESAPAKRKADTSARSKSSRVAAAPVHHRKHHIVHALYQEPPPRHPHRSIRAAIERFLIMNGY